MTDKLNYTFACGGEQVDEPGVDKTYYSTVTVSQNIDGSSVQLHVPPVPNHFLDTSEFYIRVALQVVNRDGTYIGGASEVAADAWHDVFPLGGFLNNLWSQCNIRLNGVPLPPTTDYPYVAQLVDLLGTKQSLRDNLLNKISGGVVDTDVTSLITEEQAQMYTMKSLSISGSKETVLYGRIQSGFLLSLAQLLPDNVELDIELTRGKDSFALGSANPAADYRIKLNSLTLFVKRVEFNNSAHNILRSVMAKDIHLKYQRFHSRVMYVPRDSRTFTWGNLFAGVLPRRAFFMLVDQSSYSGAINRRGTYCEAANVSEVRFLVDGRDILPEPYRPKIETIGDQVSMDSDVSCVILGLHSVMGSFFKRDLDGPSIGVGDMQSGLLIYPVLLPRHQANQSSPPGSMDISVTFNANTLRSYTAICIGEFDQCIKVTPAREITLV